MNTLTGLRRAAALGGGGAMLIGLAACSGSGTTAPAAPASQPPAVTRTATVAVGTAASPFAPLVSNTSQAAASPGGTPGSTASASRSPGVAGTAVAAAAVTAPATAGAAISAVPAGTAVASPAAVSIAGFAFAPPMLTVAAGTMVTWTNSDAVPHNVTFNSGAFPAATMDPQRHTTVTFTTPGRYDYHCAIHPFMQGTVVVGG